MACGIGRKLLTPASLEQGGNTPIHRAAWKGHTAVAEMLLKVLIDAGASLDIQDNVSDPPV